MAHTVQKVVLRCEDAKDNGGELDLSNCQLVQVPDAVYYMMRDTPLVACNLSSNVITKIPPKLPAKFTFIKRLDLSHNRMSTLPDELTGLTQLEMVDLSHNSFVSLPSCLFGAARLSSIDASHNFIADVEIDLLLSAPRLSSLNLEHNPLTRECADVLTGSPNNADCGEDAARLAASQLTVTVTTRQAEDWEDLTI